MNPNYKYWQRWAYEALPKHGLSESEITYVINRISNAVKKYDDGCLHNFRISVNGDNDEGYKELSFGMRPYDEIITLHSGTVVKFGFNGDD